MTVFDQLGEGVYRRRYESLDLNVGVVVGEDGILIVDTRSTPSEARDLLDELSSLSRLPVRWVVNTHWHWDHTFGNSEFSGAAIWGHDNCRNTLTSAGDQMKAGAAEWFPDLAEVFESVEIVPPRNTFAERATLAIGREVSMSYHGLAHTDSDILVSVADAGVTFAGDLVEEGAPPSFGDSYPLDWPHTLEIAMTSMETVVVPGHGDVVDHRFVRDQHADLVATSFLARQCLDGELDVEAASANGPYPPRYLEQAMARALLAR